MLVDLPALHTLCSSAARAAGAEAAVADSLATATVAAEANGKPRLGVEHFVDYLRALRTGQLNGRPRVKVQRARVGVITASADDGPAQHLFDVVHPALVEAAEAQGVAILSIRDSFTVGELGYYVARLARHGLVALACANTPAIVSVHGSRRPVVGTNPFAFAMPGEPEPHIIDQASSASARVTIRAAARHGRAIPEGWAIDSDGEPTTNPVRALAGSLLPFGGIKGSNLALTIELLATLSGATFALDAPSVDSTDDERPPRVGMFVLAIDPNAFDPGALHRADIHLDRLRDEHGVSFGRARPPLTSVEIPDALYSRLTSIEHTHPEGSIDA